MVRLIFLVIFSTLTWSSLAATTYITLENVDLFDAPNGNKIEQWPDRNLFTSSYEDDFWITVSGYFPEGVWQPIEPKLYISKSAKLKVKPPLKANEKPAIIHVELVSNGSKAKAYKLLADTPIYTIDPVDEQASNLVASQPQNSWQKGKVFTARYQTASYVKATGEFDEEGRWQALVKPVWILKPFEFQDRTQPRMFTRQDNTKRFAIVDKSKFEVHIYEKGPEQVTRLVSAPVALGYDRCLSEDKGGKCYYTPVGKFDIEFKLFDPDGINWCIPKKMEAEFAEKLAKGERCWRGIMGNHALHFGNSLFLHGTSNPNSLGSRTTHGCIRLRNADISLVYRLLTEGDEVHIVESFTTFENAISG